MTVRRRVVISGRVQGVWFRESCRQEATALGCVGWVRNRPDRTVEAAFEGPEAAVDALVTWCHTGPPSARVTAVEVLDELPTGATGFAVH